MSPARSTSARRTSAPTLAAVLAVTLTACNPSQAEPPAPDTRTTSAPSPTAEAPAEPSPQTSAEPSAAPSPEGTKEPLGEGEHESDIDLAVTLTGSGVANVVDGQASALPELETALGPPDELMESPLADCGAPSISTARWGPLMVNLNDGALYGWQVNSMQGLPDSVVLPHDLPLGTPLSQITALPGAGPVEYLENYQTYRVTADGVSWWFEQQDPTSPAVVVGHNILGCG